MKQRSFKNPIVVCKSCRKQVPRTSNRQWWCSRNCGEKFKRKIAKRGRERYPQYQKVCGYCLKEFKTNSTRKLFCTIKHKELFYNQLQKDLGLRTKYRQAKLCSGKWHEVLQKSKYSCELCGCSGTTKAKDGLCVHHLDGNGAYMTKPNDNFDNLIVLCRKCHKMFHGLSLIFNDGEWKIRSRFLKLLGCHSVGVM